MRIAVGSHFYVPRRMAGSETAVHAALLALRQAGHSITVFATESGGGYEHEGIEVVESHGSKLRGDLERHQPDVVLGQHSQWATVAAYAGRAGIPSVIYAHNDYPETGVALLRSPTLVAYNSHHVRETLSACSAPSVILHPPVTPSDHRTTPGNAVTLVNPSGNKGAATFYAVAARMPETEFLAVEGGHGIQIFEQRPNVSFTPQTTAMREDVWARTRILLVPSEKESYGMVAVEALASGIPVIAHPTAGLLESLGDAGIFIDRDDTASWVSKIRELSDGRRWLAASRRAKRRSGEIERNRLRQLEDWVAAVELAHRVGRNDFRRVWNGRRDR